MTVGNKYSLYNNNLGQSCKKECEVEYLVMFLGQKSHLYSILKEIKVSKIIGYQQWKRKTTNSNIPLGNI